MLSRTAVTYSSQYKPLEKNKIYTMFLASVLTGLTTEGHPSYRKPPNIPETNKSYDSVTGFVRNDPTKETFVVFDPMQHYPKYLIEFTYMSN